MEQLAVKVVRKTREAEGIASFELARVDGAAAPCVGILASDRVR